MLLINFPAPIIFALLLNEISHRKYKKTIQTLSIFPHFISWVVFGGIVIALTDMTTGIINPLLYALGIGSRDNPINLLTADYFWGLMIIVSMIKSVGWGSVIYLAAITSISPAINIIYAKRARLFIIPRASRTASSIKAEAKQNSCGYPRLRTFDYTKKKYRDFFGRITYGKKYGQYHRTR